MTFHNTYTSSAAFVGAVPNNHGRTGSVSYVKHIRTPSPTDVLSGRGGSVNQHPGNIQFRKWVNELKHEYNLAQSKVEKAQICRTVINKVLNQHPPGKFLAREDNVANASGLTPASTSTGNWWIELDDERIMAKTSQALREGAPKIREEHQDEINAAQKKEQQKFKLNLLASSVSTTSRTTNTTSATRKKTLPVSPTRTRPIRSVAATTTPSFAVAAAPSTAAKRKFDDVAPSRVVPSAHTAVAVLPALPSTSGPPPFTSKLHHHRSSATTTSSRKGPIYNSTPPQGPSNSANINHPMAMSAAVTASTTSNNHSITIPLSSASSKRVRVEYKGQHVNPSDASPIVSSTSSFGATEGGSIPSNNEPSDINHLLYSSSTTAASITAGFPLTAHALNRLEQVSSSNSSMESNDEQQVVSLSIPPYQGGISRFDKGSLKRSHSLALSDIEGWSMGGTSDFINPFEDEEEKLLSLEKQTSVSSTDTDIDTNIVVPPPVPPRVGILRDTSTNSNGDLGGIGALLHPITNSSNNANGSDVAQMTNVVNHKGTIYRSSIGRLGNDELRHERTTSITSAISFDNKQQQHRLPPIDQSNSTSNDNISKWLNFGDDFDTSSSATNIGLDWNDDVESIFVPVSP